MRRAQAAGRVIRLQDLRAGVALDRGKRHAQTNHDSALKLTPNAVVGDVLHERKRRPAMADRLGMCGAGRREVAGIGERDRRLLVAMCRRQMLREQVWRGLGCPAKWLASTSAVLECSRCRSLSTIVLIDGIVDQCVFEPQAAPVRLPSRTSSSRSTSSAIA